MRELMVRDAIREALDEEMARDNTVFQMGEDIGHRRQLQVHRGFAGQVW